ncbi:MAG: HlyC/CorC family transporter [Rickettsia endosymbiont of Sergentomyia squamirostris]|uniref:HlyC/CorC family transporter n=1 Tax=Candidatus Tisiphia endosymbiont of Sergentomyia squamirostris TaxID=3113639 RepID=A0AAT9G8Z9_9RICK
MTIFLTIIIVLMIGCAALLSATETAITASSPGKIQKFKAKAIKRNTVLQVLKNKEKVIGTLLIGNTLLNTVCTTIATSIFIDWLGDSGTVVASAVMAFVIIVFGEIIPKAIAVAKAEQLALFTSPAIMFFLKLLKPINSIFEVIVKLFCFIFRINLQQNISGAEEVRGVIEHYHQEGNVYKSDRDMLGGILDIRKMTVSEIMIHRSNIVAINVDLPKEEIVRRALLSSPHTRIPLWKDTQDNIIGVLHMRDLLRALYEKNNDAKKINIKELVNQPWFIPDNALVTHQLHAFRERKSHFACVVDEYGDLQGIITLEDILEEIVGPIIDEHDYPINTIVKKSDEEFIIDGYVTIRDVNRELNWSLPDDDANTIAGLIIHKLERIPNQGESIKIFNLSITINKKIGNRLDSIKVIILPNKESESDN